MVFRLLACAPASGKQQEELQASQGTEQGRRPRAGLKAKIRFRIFCLQKQALKTEKNLCVYPYFTVIPWF